VDNRPLSLSRSPAKDLLKLLKESYPQSQNLTTSFVYLNILCTPGTIVYDCNLDPAKSELVFEDRELVFRIFQEFLDEMFQLRPPSTASGDFFSSQTAQRLPSPPPTGPRNVYAFTMGKRGNVDSPSDGVRQTRLDEFIGKGPTVSPKPVIKEQTSPCPTRHSSELRSMMGDMDGIDLTEGIVSSRKIPKKIDTPPTPSPSLSSFVYTEPESRPMERVPLASIFTQPRTDSAFQTPSKTPRRKTTRTAKVRDPVLDSSEEKASRQVKVSDSPAPRREVDYEITENTFTIAAMSQRPKRPRHQAPLSLPEEYTFVDVAPLMLETLVLTSPVTVQGLYLSQELLSVAPQPPPFDPEEFALQYPGLILP
jgi:DNA mismatch repair ATPase MutL